MPLTRDTTDAIVVHLWGTDNDTVGLPEIRQAHRRAGMMDVGFHYIIRRDGTLDAGRPRELCGNHEPGLNATSVGVCVVAASWDSVTPGQRRAMDGLTSTLKRIYPSAKVIRKDP